MNKLSEDIPSWKSIIAITVLLTTCLAIQAMTTRVLGIGLVCMVHPSVLTKNQTQARITTHIPSTEHSGKFVWNYKVQSNIVAAHDWGELLMLPMAGWLIKAENLPFVISSSTFVSILCTTAFPTMAQEFDSKGAFVSRFLLGMAHAFSAPSIDASVAEYIPNQLRNTMYSVVLSGNQIASIFVNTISAYYCHSTLFGGWPSSFYFISLLGALWLMVWVVRSAMKQHLTTKHHQVNRMQQTSKLVRYKKLLGSAPLWALLSCNIASIWTTRLLMYYIPSFYRDVLRLSLMENGIFSSLPFLTLCFGKIIFSFIATWLTTFENMTKNLVSKFFNSLAFIGSGSLILCCTSFQTTSPTNILVYVTVAGLLFSATSPGFRWSIVSLNQKHTALVSSMCTTASMVGAIVFPYIVGFLVKNGTKSEWHNVFLVVVVVDISAALIYCLFGSVEQKSEHVFIQSKMYEPLLIDSSDSDANP